MFGMFKKDPVRDLRKRMQAKLQQARDLQRSGDIIAAAQLHQEVEVLQRELDALEPPR
jgi:hypothetical protein